MSVADPIESASRRLALALEALEAAVDLRRESDRNEDALTTQIHMLGDDRARLTAELDQAAACSRVLQTASREVAARVAQAIETIRAVLASEE